MDNDALADSRLPRMGTGENARTGKWSKRIAPNHLEGISPCGVRVGS